MLSIGQIVGSLRCHFQKIPTDQYDGDIHTTDEIEPEKRFNCDNRSDTTVCVDISLKG
jgi:hypothetical protein